VANLIVWLSLLERQQRVVQSAGLLACRGRVQREGEVIHLIAEHLIDLSGLLRSVGERDEPFPVPHGRGDEVKHGGDPDQRAADGLGRKPRDIYIPDLRLAGQTPEPQRRRYVFRLEAKREQVLAATNKCLT
jgi:error-prone DNA polymerase